MVKNILESVTLGVEAYLKEVPITDSKKTDAMFLWTLV